MKTVVVTGSQGFIGGYLCKELLEKGYGVVGIDNFSKYGDVNRDHDSHENFRLVRADLSKPIQKEGTYNPVWDAFMTADYIIAAAAMIGGISYFHKHAYDLLATNERIIANTFDGAIESFQDGRLKRIVVISSSMVFEGADIADDELVDYSEHYPPWPTKEGAERVFSPPHSTYGFQKLSTEYFAKGAAEQYGLPYTIVRPFNCVGLGEEDAIGDEEIMSGNVKLMMSHVLPDLVNKCLKGQDPLHILGDGKQVRCYTHGKDIARGIIMAMESAKAESQDYNISTTRSTTVLELAEMVWKRINIDKEFRYVSDEPYMYDVQKRIPCVNKAKEHFGFEAEISLEESVEEIVSHMTHEKVWGAK